MKTPEQRLREARRPDTEAAVANHLAALFERMPMLCGFVLRHDFEIAEVSVCTWPGYTAGQDLYDDLLQALADFAEERPEAVQLMRGRSFARAIH